MQKAIHYDTIVTNNESSSISRDSMTGIGKVIDNMTGLDLTAIIQTEIDYSYLYNNLCTYFLQWYLPIVITVGILGTGFCLAFLFLSKLFPRSLLLWLVSICIGDFMILATDGIWLMLKVIAHYDLQDENNVVCKLHKYFSNYFFYWSSYMQACMSLQRLYLIVKPIQARTELPFRRLFTAWFVCSVALLIPVGPYFVWNIERNHDCDPPDDKYFIIMTLNDMILWGIVPMLSMILSTSIITHKVFRFQSTFVGKQNGGAVTEGPIRNRLRSLSRGNIKDALIRMNKAPDSQLGTPRLGGSSNDIPMSANNLTPTSCGEAQCGRRHGGSDNAGHVTKLLITINLWYMVTTFPFLIYLMVLNFAPVTIPRGVHKFLYYLFRSFCYLNSSFNWFFYCAVGRVFRKRAKRVMQRLFCCNKNGSNSWSLPGDAVSIVGNQVYQGVAGPNHQRYRRNTLGVSTLRTVQTTAMMTARPTSPGPKHAL